jgi:hypothetical protein
MQQVSFMSELTQRYHLPEWVTISALDKDTIEFCSPSNKDRDILMNHHLPKLVKVAADLGCAHIQLRYLNASPDRTLKLDLATMQRFISGLGKDFFTPKK